MNGVMNKIWNLAMPLLSWSLYLIGLSFLFGYANGRVTWELVTRAFEMIILVPAVYYNTRIITPDFLYRQKYVYYILFTFAIVVVLVFYNSLIWYTVAPLITKTPASVNSFWDLLQPYYLFICLIDVALAWSIATGYALLATRHNEEQEIIQRKNQLLQAELRHLKAQIQPHFFFNTLNNIYSLSLENSAKVSNSILQLSAMMEYLLHDSTEDRQPLHRELDFLQNYVNLELLRFRYPQQVNYEVRGSADGKLIPPLLFLPLVENAFKHVDRSVSPYFISILIDIQEHGVTCLVRNNFQSSAERKGFGLENLRKRLILLYGSGSLYRLSTRINENTYESTLQIPFYQHD